MIAEAVSAPAWGLIGIVVGAVLGLLPKFFDLYSANARGDEELVARLRMMLANVLMNCVHSTNEFLNQAALLRLNPAPSPGAGTTHGDLPQPDEAEITDPELRQPDEAEITDPDLRKAIELAFAMKTAWMDALVSFGDPTSDKEPVDRRRTVIQKMLKDLDDTYGVYQAAEATPEQITLQLQRIAAVSRIQLQQLIGLPSGP